MYRIYVCCGGSTHYLLQVPRGLAEDSLSPMRLWLVEESIMSMIKIPPSYHPLVCNDGEDTHPEEEP